MDPSTPTATLDFLIREGFESFHNEVLLHDEKLLWEVVVEAGMDIEVSVRATASSPAKRGTWILIEPHRATNLCGIIDPSSLIENGIKLPVTLQFRLDNTYSWFNSKNVHLSIKKDTSPPMLPQQSVNASEPPSAPRSPDMESVFSSEEEKRRDSRSKADLEWLNHVIGEALIRCPPSVPAVRKKLEEAKMLLIEQGPGNKTRAII